MAWGISGSAPLKVSEKGHLEALMKSFQNDAFVHGLPQSISTSETVFSMANMLQPFWALPLLGITKLRAKEILSYTLVFMFLGATIYVAGLLFF